MAAARPNARNDVVDALAAKFKAPREVIDKDVTELLQGLADKGFIVS